MVTLKNLAVAPIAAMFTTLGTVSAVQAATFYGETQSIGNGEVRSYVTLDDNGNPIDIGVSFNEGALESLPTGDDESDIKLRLSLPSEASSTAFEFIDFIYHPNAPAGTPATFDVPRFEVDYFTISTEEQASICPNPDTSSGVPTCVGDELAQVLKTPESGVIPEGLATTGTAEPGIGLRYYDPDVSIPIAIGAAPYNSLYDYAFFDGKLSLIDTVASISYLQTQPNVTNSIKTPTTYSKSGYYPTSYSLAYDSTTQEYRFSLSGLTYRSIPEFSPTLGLLAVAAVAAVSGGKAKLKKHKCNG